MFQSYEQGSAIVTAFRLFRPNRHETKAVGKGQQGGSLETQYAILHPLDSGRVFAFGTQGGDQGNRVRARGYEVQ